MTTLLSRASGAAGLAIVLAVAACTHSSPNAGAAAPRGGTVVGPPRGSVVVVGGGSMGPEVYSKFIELAGGPDALIIDVPTAGGDSVYPPNTGSSRGWKAAGAKNVIVLHTIDRRVAESDSFVAPLRRAGGVWFEGGRHYHLVDSYAGTKTEREFHNVLARGGVIGGSSAGASILGSFLVRGAPSNNNAIMVYPGYTTGFAFLRGVGIDQHVVARERLADLADSVLPRYKELLGISEDEGTAWVVRGDSAEIIGRNKAFVYGGKDATDPGAPFLTLRPGDKYDLARRHVTHRAIDGSPLTHAFVDSLFAPFTRSGATAATVLVAMDGRVLVNRSYGIPSQAKYMPTTTVPNFSLGGLSDGFNAMAALLVARDGKLNVDDPLGGSAGVTVRQFLTHERDVPGGSKLLADLVATAGSATYPQVVARRLFTPIGAHKTVAGADGQFQSSVDELYRWELGLESGRAFVRDTVSDGSAPTPAPAIDYSLGWRADTYRGLNRLSEFGIEGGKRNALVRVPSRKAVIIILTNDDAADVRTIADRITDRLLVGAVQR
jgi:cyanophycinase